MVGKGRVSGAPATGRERGRGLAARGKGRQSASGKSRLAAMPPLDVAARRLLASDGLLPAGAGRQSTRSGNSPAAQHATLPPSSCTLAHTPRIVDRVHAGCHTAPQEVTRRWRAPLLWADGHSSGGAALHGASRGLPLTRDRSSNRCHNSQDTSRVVG